ncbi:MAG: hypothetical protein SangKO_030180 [Sandaracinaceae bacterium]
MMEAAPLPEAVRVEPRRTRRRPPTEGEPPATPIARIDPEEFEGLTREIEDPRGAMRGFYRRLAAVERDEPVLARMGVYGTSTNGADRMTSQLRRLLQRRFGDGGKGWVPVAAGWRYQRHQDVEWRYDHWRTYVVNRANGPLDRYGWGGVLAVNRHRGAESEFATTASGPGSRVSRFRIFHQAFPEGGRLSVRVDDGPPRIIDTSASEPTDRVEEIEVPDGAHTLQLSAVGEGEGQGEEDLRLYGVTMERDGPGVVVDGLALIGAFTRVLRLFDREHLSTQVRQRDPNLVVFWMGANERRGQRARPVRRGPVPPPLPRDPAPLSGRQPGHELPGDEHPRQGRARRRRPHPHPGARAAHGPGAARDRPRGGLRLSSTPTRRWAARARCAAGTRTARAS